MRIVHFSDVHVQADYLRLPLKRFGWRRMMAQLELIGLRRAQRYLDADRVLRRIAEEIQALDPDHALLSGDLTALALEEEFLACRQALGRLVEDPRRFSIIPGNHDRYTANSVSTQRFERHFGHLLASDVPVEGRSGPYPFVRLVNEGLAVVGLDSTRLAPVPGLSFGRVDRRQMESLARLLDHPELQRRFVCVMVHHAPLHHNGQPDRFTHGLLNARPLMKLLAGRPCALFHGHVHQRYWHPANADRPDVFGAGSSTMSGDEGYWVLEIRDGQVAAAAIHHPGSLPPGRPAPEEELAPPLA